jgi:hypothetical protein
LGIVVFGFIGAARYFFSNTRSVSLGSLPDLLGGGTLGIDDTIHLGLWLGRVLH